MRNVWILALAQAFSACGTIMLVTFGGIVGTQITPIPALATLPLSMSILGVALCSLPAAALMRRIGRKPGFVGSALVATCAALICAFSIAHESFIGLCVAGFLLGSNMAFVQQYRFAATEYVSELDAGRAVSTVMLGTLVAAWLGPELGDRLRLLGGWAEFSGSFVGLAVLLLLGALVLLALEAPLPRATVEQAAPRPLRVIAAQPRYIVALLAGLSSYVVMSFIMTATPISMHVLDGMSVGETKRVISTHLLAMYLPSLASGWLIRVLGTRMMMYLGIACMGTCVIISSVVGHHFVHYLTGLALLGVGWNFLFVSGTTLLTTTYRPAERFAAQGLNDFTIFGSQAIASFAAGPAITLLGWRPLNLIAVPVLVGMLFAVWRLGKHSHQPARNGTAAAATASGATSNKP
ncbi:MAG: MFS transporter [Pseudomonadales bacterium]|nr:MFS transporter [Pseudomonadales bacterium]